MRNPLQRLLGRFRCHYCGHLTKHSMSFGSGFTGFVAFPCCPGCYATHHTEKEPQQ
jgi:hypothetical protein